MINLTDMTPVEGTKNADQFGMFEDFENPQGVVQTLYTPWTKPYGSVLDTESAQWI